MLHVGDRKGRAFRVGVARSILGGIRGDPGGYETIKGRKQFAPEPFSVATQHHHRAIAYEYIVGCKPGNLFAEIDDNRQHLQGGRVAGDRADARHGRGFVDGVALGAGEAIGQGISRAIVNGAIIVQTQTDGAVPGSSVDGNGVDLLRPGYTVGQWRARNRFFVGVGGELFLSINAERKVGGIHAAHGLTEGQCEVDGLRVGRPVHSADNCDCYGRCRVDTQFLRRLIFARVTGGIGGRRHHLIVPITQCGRDVYGPGIALNVGGVGGSANVYAKCRDIGCVRKGARQRGRGVVGQ